MAARWKVRISKAAQQDFDSLYLWTIERFGSDQADAYRRLVLDALISLDSGPDTLGVKGRAELPENIKILHVARKGKRGRHIIVFDVSMPGRIQVLRILHDAMDVPRHVAVDDEAES